MIFAIGVATPALVRLAVELNSCFDQRCFGKMCERPMALRMSMGDKSLV